MLPLEGITVVSLEQAVAAPFATRQLADLGARMIKVERPGAGDFARDYDRSAPPGQHARPGGGDGRHPGPGPAHRHHPRRTRDERERPDQPGGAPERSLKARARLRRTAGRRRVLRYTGTMGRMPRTPGEWHAAARPPGTPHGLPGAPRVSRSGSLVHNGCRLARAQVRMPPGLPRSLRSCQAGDTFSPAMRALTPAWRGA
jgi:hypothetical protein